MRKLTILCGLFYVVNSYAVTESIVWDTKEGLQKASYSLQSSKTASHTKKHKRYDLTYKGIPIWGYQLIEHKVNHKTLITGVRVTGIEKELPSLDGKLSIQTIEAKLLKEIQGTIKFKHSQKVIFIDSAHKAHLAYHIHFYVNSDPNLIAAPNYIIDANNGEILKSWDDIPSEKIGQGPGGNTFALPYRPGLFQYGTALPKLLSLGKFDVQQSEGLCHVKNASIMVINLENQIYKTNAFPFLIEDEEANNIQAFAYPCNAANFYLNDSDDDNAPINYSMSPVNDTMYFANKTLKMYQKTYGVAAPLGTDLPIRAYTHVATLDNAFALPSIYSDDKLVAHQQIVIGNGEIFLTAPSQTIVAHEISHNFTAVHSDLVYSGESGAINESFSDMAIIALKDYLRKKYSWYWDGMDWAIGREAMLGGEPLRYMDDPPKDGHSIAHTKYYDAMLNPHYGSGIFNKAFYLLANKPNWSITQAFQVMVDANRFYWSPNVSFNLAACGVIQAAKDRGFESSSIIEVFAEVGVTCPVDVA